MKNLQPSDQNIDAPTYTNSGVPPTENQPGNRSSVLPELAESLSIDTPAEILNTNVNKKRLSRRETYFTTRLSSQTHVDREAVHSQDYEGARSSVGIEDPLNSDSLVRVSPVSPRTSPKHDQSALGYPLDVESSGAIGDSIEVGLFQGAHEEAGEQTRTKETHKDNETFTESFTEVTPHKVTSEFQENLISVDGMKQSIGCLDTAGENTSVQAAASGGDSGSPALYDSLQEGMGHITVHRSYPGVVGDFNYQDPLPRSALGTASRTYVEPSFEMAFDDSVFPTRHRLETSEDLRAAMMEARRCHYNQSRLEKDGPDRMLGNILSGSLQRHNRFPSSNGGELQLKYRHLMSFMHRYSFNNWKRDISARSGQTPADFHKQETPPNSLTSVEKILEQGCPRCLQFNTSNIYGKPCLCRRYSDSHPRVKGGTRTRSSCLKTKKPSSRAEHWKVPIASDANRKTRIAEHLKAMESHFGGIVSDEHLKAMESHFGGIVSDEHLKAMESHFGGIVSDVFDREAGERRLNLSLATSPTCATKDEHLSPGSPLQDRPMDSAIRRPDEPKTSQGRVHKLAPLKTRTNVLSASRQSSPNMSKQISETPLWNSALTSPIPPINDDLAYLNSRSENRDDRSESLPLKTEGRNRPLRGWEISKLESTLKRCMVERQKNWRSSKHSLLNEPDLWTLFRI